MAQSFLHAGEHSLIVAGFEIDHAVACEACLSDGRSEQVRARDAPEDLALGAGGEARAERGGCRPVDRAVTAAGYLMQGAERETTARES